MTAVTSLGDESRRRRGCDVDIRGDESRRSTPRLRRGYSMVTRRGDAAVPTWIFPCDESRRRRGRDVDSPWSRGDAAATT